MRCGVWRLLALLCLWGSHAAALSCLPNDVARTFQELDADSARWGAVVGRLDFDEGRLPRVDWDQQAQTPAETRLRAQLVGHSLGPDGWTTPFQANVSLIVECWGPWCAQPQSGRRYLVFVKREPHGRLAFADPCGTRLIANPSPDDLDRLHLCFVDGPCAPQPPFPQIPSDQ